MKKLLLSLAVVFSGLLLLSGCGDDKKAEDYYTKQIKDKGTLVVATSADFPPFEFQILEDGKNKIVGSDIDLANAIGKELGVKVEVNNMDFNSVLNALQSGKADMVLSGISARPDRKKTFDFSETYYASVQKLIVKKADLAKYNSIAAFDGQKVGAQQGSIQAEVIEEQLPKANAVNMDTVPNLINSLKAGQINGLVLEEAIGKAFIQSNPDLAFADIELKSSEDDAFAVAMPKDSGDLLKKVNEVIKKLKSEGKIDEFVQNNYDLAEKNK
ncbi:MAG: transporter substrate-binding domain-containing protein [Lactobacillales bacterium]|jgi:polar amino acid transport system substrate-binding protein|nr:transporter substrate-binding domain-containing protein [Lactobacillales bacterium]